MSQSAANNTGISREQVRRMLGVSERQLRSWETQGFIRAREAYSFADLIPLRTLQQLRKNRVPPARVKSALTALRQTLRHVDDPLKELKILADGRRVRVVVEGQPLEPESGQLLLDFNRSEIQQLVKLPDREQEQRKQAADNWFARGLELEASDSPVAEVIEAYEKAVQLEPRLAGALVNLGTIYFNARALARAESFYRRAVEADPEYALAHYNLANLYDERGDHARAVEHYLKALKIRPAYADAHYNLALLYQTRGKVMEAVRHWNSYIKLDPGSEWADMARRELDKLKRATVVRGRA